ncbi:TfoX/Sxy family protein [Nocardioides sp.]|uniref:TfoX/Sxy family protein n=1 Tax=Nocardioides sp. TaxID=35761 RepID=UPI003527CE01
MAYDEELADRVRGHLEGLPDLREQRMFGGLAFLVGGHMAVAASGQGGLLLRCDPADTDRHTAEPGVDRFVMRHREMNGWLAVAASAVATEPDLERWVGVGLAYAASLPPK